MPLTASTGTNGSSQVNVQLYARNGARVDPTSLFSGLVR